jgi:hypothetical protein
MPILAAERSKARVCSRLLAVITVSNPAGDMDGCLLRLFYDVRYRYLRLADPSSRGVLLTVMCHCSTSVSGLFRKYLFLFYRVIYLCKTDISLVVLYYKIDK